MNGFFEHNLRLLSEYDPKLADRLQRHIPSDRVEVLHTAGGEPSLRLYHHDGSPHLLHSSRDPVREAQRWASGIELPMMYNLMVFGCGLMFHCIQLVLRYQKRLKNLVIVERNLDVLYSAFAHTDLTPFLQTKSTFFLADCSPSEIRGFMNDHLTPFVLDGLEIIEHPASIAMDPDYYVQVRRAVQESLQSGEILLRTKVRLGGMIQENIIRNVPMVLSNPSASGLGSLLTQVPAYVVGAGPSLDWNFDRLADIGDKGVIIAVDTVLKKLKERGIRPHLVVTSDPTYLNARHFDGIENLDETILVFSPSVYHEILKRLKGTLVSLPLPTSRFMRSLRNVVGDLSYMTIGINVGQTGFNLARYLGCDPIALVGMDFSFPRAGGMTHASGTAWRRRITISDTPGKMMVELLGDQPALEEFDPILIPGNREEIVATNKFWFAYLRSMEEEIKKTRARVFNCTEGGARIEGAEHRTLAEVIAEFCVMDRMVHSTLAMSVGFFFGSGMEEGISVYKEAKEILQLAAEKAEEGSKQVDALETIATSASPNPDLLKEQMQRITETHKALIQNQKVYSVLDEAADRVLYPLMQQEGRPVGDEPTPENVNKTITRYRAYFSGMKELCGQFTGIFEETLTAMDTFSPWGF